MKYSLVFFCSALCLLATIPALGQRDSLSLQQAIDMALKNNRIVTLGEIEQQQNESRLKEVKTNLLPFFFLRSHYLYAPPNGYSEVVTNGGEYGLQLTTGIPVFDAGVRNTTIHQASNFIERSSIDLQKSKTELTLEVRSAFYEIVHARNELQIRQETVRRLQDYDTFLTQLQQGGGVNAGDVLKARVELNNANIEVGNAQQELVKDKMVLNRLTGNTITQEFEIESPEIGDTTSIPQFTVEESPELQLLHHDKIAADDDIAIARAERMPTVSFAGDVGWLGVTPNEYRQNFGYSLFLNLDFPLWSWGGVDARIEQKEITQQLIDTQMEIQRRDLELQWNTTVTDITFARSALGAYSRNIADAEKNYLLAKSRFAGGSGSNLEVLDAQRFLVEVQIAYNNSLLQLNHSLATALKLSGK